MSHNNEIPKGWQVVRLGDLVKTEKGKKPKTVSNEKTPRFKIPYVNIKAFEKNIIDEYTDGVGCVFCEEGDFLMVWDGARSGYVGRAIKGALGSTLAKLTFPKIVDGYAFYFLQSKFIEINTRGKGVGIPHVDPNLLWNYSFPLPPPPEQHRIVEKIEALFSELEKGIEQLKTAQQQLKVYRQSVLKWAFEGKLTEEWRLNYDSRDSMKTMMGDEKTNHSLSSNQNNHSSDNLLSRIRREREAQAKASGKKLKPITPLTEKELAELPELPEGWAWASTVELCSSVRDGTHTTPGYVEKGVPLVTSKNLKNGIIDFSTTKNITRKDHDEIKLRSGVEPGDVIMAMIGTVGNPVVVKTDSEFSIKNVALFKKNEATLSSAYLKYWLESPEFRNALERRYLKGTTQRFIPLEHLRALPIPFSALAEQHQIVQEIETRLSVCDKLEETITASLQQAEALRQSILKKAFEGKLVEQDPSDPPASELLERIKKEKAPEGRNVSRTIPKHKRTSPSGAT
jgi:type I restriction enzyme S subunit